MLLENKKKYKGDTSYNLKSNTDHNMINHEELIFLYKNIIE